jgi:hypothetical protein
LEELGEHAVTSENKFKPKGKFLVSKFEFGGNFFTSLIGDCHKRTVTPNLELIVTFGMRFEGVCYEVDT